FFNQEPGSADKIQEFCSANYGVTFPLFSKIDVKGSHQHPLYEILSEAADDAGKAGNVKWNFEKFLVGRDGQVVRRFRSKVTPEDTQLVEAINSLLWGRPYKVATMKVVAQSFSWPFRGEWRSTWIVGLVTVLLLPVAFVPLLGYAIAATRAAELDAAA